MIFIKKKYFAEVVFLLSKKILCKEVKGLCFGTRRLFVFESVVKYSEKK